MELQEAYELFKSIPFPDNKAVNEELADIYFELADYDGYVAGTIDKLLNKKEVNRKELEYDITLENKITDFLKEVNNTEDSDYVTATEMINYLKGIKGLITIAVSESKSIH